MSQDENLASDRHSEEMFACRPNPLFMLMCFTLSCDRVINFPATSN